MKKLLQLVLFCIPFFGISQDINRKEITGKIIIEGNDIEGITIYNSTSSTGTVTNKSGEFIISAGLNDLIEIRALEYQNFDVIINKAILKSKTIHVFLIEEINILDEVVITNKKLSGNLKTDINRVKTFSPKQNVIYFGIKKNETYNFTGDNKSKIINTATNTHGHLEGLNIVNIVDQLLIPLFRSEVKNKKEAGVPEVPAKSIKYYLGSNFLIENFSIPEHRVEEFIRYVEDETFDFQLLNYGHEIDFLELINKKSKTFLNPKKEI
jgi:hypothetical protein